MPPEFPEGENPDVSGTTLLQRLASPAKALRAMLARAADSRLKAALLVGVCLLSLGGVVTLWLVWRAARAPQDVTLETALEALDRGAYGEARQMAETLRDGGLSAEQALGAPAFLLGAAAAYEADHAWNVETKSRYLLAARYLEEARDLGFPPGRQGEGLLLLGRSLYLSGQLPACRPVLRQAIEANPRRKTEIHHLLAAAYLEDANPKFQEALQHNEAYLADPALSRNMRYEGMLQRAEILLALGETSACRSTLDAIPPSAKNHVEAILTRGRLLMHEARALKDTPGAVQESQPPAVEKYQAAIKTLRLAQGRDTLALQAGRKAMYLIGLCFLESGDYRAALNQFGRIPKRYPDSPEALAADFQIAELSRRLDRDDDALAAYRRALKAVHDVKQYRNPWLALDELRAALLKAYEHYRDVENFEIALRLVRLLYPIFSRARTIELLAETYQLWGQSALARAGDLPRSKAEPLRRDGRAKLRRAGRAYEQLARLRVTTRHFGDDLWDSAECYREGQGYEHAVKILQEYLKSQSRRRHPRALLYLGESLLALGQIDDALAALEECIEFHPRDAASFRARLAASEAHLEQGDLEQAERLLDENLAGDFLTPDSSEWRDSIFALGQILHLARRYEEATRYLEEAVARYPDSPQATEARYLLADCYRRRAAVGEEQLADDLVESARRARSQRISELLDAALTSYQQTQESLNQRQQVTELTPLERSMLRNCYFSIGSIRFDLEQYDEAVKAYSIATHRYQNVPEVLEAYVQIARAYRRLDRPDESQRALEQAKVVLDRMKDPENFELTTIYTHQRWPELLDWLSYRGANGRINP